MKGISHFTQNKTMWASSAIASIVYNLLQKPRKSTLNDYSERFDTDDSWRDRPSCSDLLP